jgi:hypothetical protein
VSNSFAVIVCPEFHVFFLNDVIGRIDDGLGINRNLPAVESIAFNESNASSFLTSTY